MDKSVFTCTLIRANHDNNLAEPRVLYGTPHHRALEQIMKKLKFLTTFEVTKMCAVAEGAAFGPVAK